MKFATEPELQELLPHFLDAPKDAAPVLELCLRPDFGKREFVSQITMTREFGMPGERWGRTPWMKLEDGSPDPRIQVSILGKRVMDACWLERDLTPHPGDPIIADMDFSQRNMPDGQLLAVGTAVLRVSDVFNDACVKWKTRYGAEAKEFVARDEHRQYRLRGVLCEVVRDGTASVGDIIRKISTAPADPNHPA